MESPDEVLATVASAVKSVLTVIDRRYKPELSTASLPQDWQQRLDPPSLIPARHAQPVRLRSRHGAGKRGRLIGYRTGTNVFVRSGVLYVSHV